MIARSRAAARSLVTALAAALVLGACTDDPGAFRGIPVEPPEPAPALRLATAAGDTFDLAEQRGHVVLLFFGYTQCPDVCPVTLSDWARLRTALGDDADEVRFVFVSVDPARDTPAIAADYARKFHPSFIGLAADAATLPALMQRYRITAFDTPAEVATAAAIDTGMGHAEHAPADGTVSDSLAPAGAAAAGQPGYYVAHSSQVFLVDPEGRVRALYPSGSTMEDLLADVKRVMD